MENNPYLPLIVRYFEKDILNATESLEQLEEDKALAIIRSLPAELSIQAIRHLQISFAASILKEAEPSLFNSIISSLEPQVAATLYAHIPKDARDRFYKHIPEDIRVLIREALTYPQNSIGRIMSSDFISLSRTMSVKDAIEKIRRLAQKKFPSSYVYVVDEEDHLIGVMNMRDLMLASSEDILEHVMRRELFSLHCFTDIEEAANELSKRKYFAVPVVDSQEHILGIIKAEQLLAGIQGEIAEDIQRLFGAGADETTFSPVRFCLTKRLPWLHVNLATAFLAALVVAFFQDIISRVTMLAVFLPIIAGQGGNAGAQSLAIVMRGLVMREIPKNRILQLLFKESLIGFVNGIVLGIVTGVIAAVWYQKFFFGMVVGLSMCLTLLIAGFAGAFIPIFMKSLKFDPAQSSNIIITTVTDVMGFFTFLGFATLFIQYL